MNNPVNPYLLMKKQFQSPTYLPGELVDQEHLSDEEQNLISSVGISMSQLNETFSKEMTITMNRYEIYSEVRRAMDHWLVGAGLKLYANFVTNYSQLHDATVWATSESSKIEREIRKLFDRIGIEEKIFDWAYSTAGYGDLFVKINAAPGIGITSIEDDEHPLNLSRVEMGGILVGFFPTPLAGANSQIAAEKNQTLIPPWEYVHFRILGARKSRALQGDAIHDDYRAVHLLGGATDKQLTSKYGTSLAIDALIPYKRLRMAEDSLLLARLTRGILRYIYKIKVNSNNAKAVMGMIDQYTAMLKNARALNTSGSGNFDSKSNPMSSMEDILLPVWGDTGDISIDKIGGDVDVRWIVDLDGLRNQCAAALKCPLCLLGAYIQESSGQLGDQAIEQLDIGFARTARRLQRALIEGITRIIQIHLSYMNMDPDTELYTVHMAETSTAEEESLKKSLSTGVDVVNKIMDMVVEIEPDIDKAKVFDVLNKKLLKLQGFNLADFQGNVNEATSSDKELKEAAYDKIGEQFLSMLKGIKQTRKFKLANTDLKSYLPITELNINKHAQEGRVQKVWERKFKEKTIKITLNEKKEDKKK